MEALSCPKCGASLIPNQNHCEYCGTYFQVHTPTEEARVSAYGGLGNRKLAEFNCSGSISTFSSSSLFFKGPLGMYCTPRSNFPSHPRRGDYCIIEDGMLYIAYLYNGSSWEEVGYQYAVDKMP